MRWRLRHDRVQMAVPVSGGRLERAAAGFNASEAGRTARGLVRTLGTPRVSLGAAAGAAEQVRVTVAWELAWYQWVVDLGEEAVPVVHELAKGREVAELDSAARQWNASALEGGMIAVGAPPPEHAAGGPARR